MAVAEGVVGDLADLLDSGASEFAPAVQPQDSSGPGPAWQAALAPLWTALIAEGVDANRADLHRLAWLERSCWGQTTLASLPTSPENIGFVRDFMACDPALPVFLDLRRSMGGAQVEEVA